MMGLRPMILKVEKGHHAKHIVSSLVEQGHLKGHIALYAFFRLSGVSQQFQAGEYAIDAQTTPLSLLLDLKSGRVIHYKLTLVEGWTFQQLQAYLDQLSQLEHSVPSISKNALLKKLKVNWPFIEGVFYPTTYLYHAGTSDLECYRRASDKMSQLLNREWGARAQHLPYHNQHEALIAASLIQRETHYEDEYATIASVIVNRLNRGMRLQIDACVRYGLGRFSGYLSKKDLSQKTPYNTYLNKGLPPTPIALVSPAALHAALHPDTTRFLFYVLSSEGRHIFSEHFKAHRKAAQAYRTYRDQGR
tara:strand:+ start:428 stop:1339 length:912 start_codon:yes stop_codon:yes gene_type:complete